MHRPAPSGEGSGPGKSPVRVSSKSRRPLWRRWNIPAGFGALIWLVVIGAPLYALVASTLRTRDDYLEKGALSIPGEPTLENYNKVLESSFFQYLVNTAIVTVASAAIVIVLSVTIGYTVVRTRTRMSQRFFQVFLLGLAIPAQAVIIPVYLIITKLNLYDSLLGIILPVSAFSLPVCVLILSGTMRDIDEEMYESMALDGAGPARILWQLVVPLSRSGISTVGVYAALQAWNNFLFPLILTQSQETKVLTLGLYDFVGQFRVDIPALLAAVVLSIVPIFVVYLFARRQLVNGLMGVGGK
ncbi:ABC transporter permease [Streptomyces sp. Ru87]|uniref:Carbohydrate ABC transporter permease n=1 Tax=Streptomyces lycii TaxID=2654337 RepID=A0ABQ7FRU6_9ACTN|nr:carbohydrate ABC transporter permease [Streptomyces lycii]PGH50494.1 ABC transporter permease [Streptomyces sp. Ru87]